MDEAQDLEDNQHYWAHLVVAAYQASTSQDNDPDNEVPGLGDKGLTWNLLGVYHSGIYLETIREELKTVLLSPGSASRVQKQYRFNVSGTVAHEIAHVPPRLSVFGDDHDEGGLLGAGQSDALNLTFTPATIHRFRGTKSWSEAQ